MLHSIESCRLINIPQKPSTAGSSCGFVNGLHTGPFDVKRFFFIYDVPHNARRGAHAHKMCHQLLIPVCGSFQVIVEDPLHSYVHSLSSPTVGLHIPPGVWASEVGFSSGSVCLVLASELYDAEDYIRDWNVYEKYVLNEV